MATNQVPLSVYQINQRQFSSLADSQLISFPSTGVMLGDCTNSPTRSLPIGVNVYAFVQDVNGNKYYVSNTLSALVALFNA